MEVTTTTKLSPTVALDYEQVLLAIDGNQRAYEYLMNKYRHSVFHTMLKMIHNADDAEDLTMEAFGKAFRKLHSYEPRFAFSTWLFRIAINNCIDHIRKKRLQVLSIDDMIMPDADQSFAGNISSESRNPEEHCINEQKLEHMRDLVSRLSPKYRLMIELRYFEELSYDDIATELNIPLGTVKAQLFRAKEMLYQMILKTNSSSYLHTTKRRPKKESPAPLSGASLN